jgi:hypothetical protein
MRDVALAHAGGVAGVEEAVRASRPPAPARQGMGWVLLALRNAFAHLNAGTDFEAALIETVAMGGDTDTNAAIAGALLGAADGRIRLPARWVMPVLTCRADAGLQVRQPRPDVYWADDLIDLTEALLLCGGHHD